MMKVKICGITNKDDAVWALNYGADYLGLNFCKESSRYISLKYAKSWVNQLPGFSTLVGVFVNAPTHDIAPTVFQLGLKGVQLHGEESPAQLAELRSTLEEGGRSPFLMKAFPIRDKMDLDRIPPYLSVVDYLLLDSFVPGQPGGTGEVFNWDLAVQAKEFGKPIFLAGGLTSDNVKDAIKKVDPAGVDVASGVEKSPKRKDLNKVQKFIINAKSIQTNKVKIA